LTTNQSTVNDNVIVNQAESIGPIADSLRKKIMSDQQKPIALGMVGGGPDSGIGSTHRIAIRIDNKCELVAGAFSRNRAKSTLMARELGIPDDRTYDDYESMAGAESKRKDKIDAVCVVTPTDSHFEIAKTFLESGIHVICDKPLCVSLNEAKELQELADKLSLIVCLTHNYTGYAMVRQAARMVRNGALGEIKAVHVEHASGWASKLQEDEKEGAPSWRMDPARLGDASLLLDLGTHAHHLARFVTGLDVTQIAGELSTIVPGRAIKDNGQAMLRFENEARGTMWISMAAMGNEQGIRIRVYGDRGSLEWFHEDPFHLRFSPVNGPTQTFAQGTEWVSEDARRCTRGGLGHPEGYFEAFANLYSEVADVIRAKGTGRDGLGFPVALDGAKGLAFVEAFLRSYYSGGSWTAVETV
jgi:predicted dehydrogenase